MMIVTIPMAVMMSQFPEETMCSVERRGLKRPRQQQPQASSLLLSPSSPPSRNQLPKSSSSSSAACRQEMIKSNGEMMTTTSSHRSLLSTTPITIGSKLIWMLLLSAILLTAHFHGVECKSAGESEYINQGNVTRTGVNGSEGSPPSGGVMVNDGPSATRLVSSSPPPPQPQVPFIEDDEDDRIMGITPRDVPILIGAAVGAFGLIVLIVVAVLAWHCCQFAFDTSKGSLGDDDHSERGSVSSTGSGAYLNPFDPRPGTQHHRAHFSKSLDGGRPLKRSQARFGSGPLHAKRYSAAAYHRVCIRVHTMF